MGKSGGVRWSCGGWVRGSAKTGLQFLAAIEGESSLFPYQVSFQLVTHGLWQSEGLPYLYIIQGDMERKEVSILEMYP